MVQIAAKCVIGVDYPKPIVDHNIISKTNIKRMKIAYEANRNKGGDDDNDDDEEGGKKKPAAKKTKKNDSPEAAKPKAKRSRH